MKVDETGQPTEMERAKATPAFHGGKSFEAIGEDFGALEHAEEVVNADVLDAWFEPSPRVIEKLVRFLPFLLRTSPPVHARRGGSPCMRRSCSAGGAR